MEIVPVLRGLAGMVALSLLAWLLSAFLLPLYRTEELGSNYI